MKQRHAREILQRVKAAAPKRAQNPFKHQYSFNPGAKIPTHQKLRQNKVKDRSRRNQSVYQRPWVGDSPNQLPKRLKNHKPKPIKVIS